MLARIRRGSRLIVHALAVSVILTAGVVTLDRLSIVLIDAQAERMLRPIAIQRDYRRDVSHCLTGNQSQSLWDCIRDHQQKD